MVEGLWEHLAVVLSRLKDKTVAAPGGDRFGVLLLGFALLLGPKLAFAFGRIMRPLLQALPAPFTAAC